MVRKRSKAPVYTVLVIDATTGQNGLSQARVFDKALDLDGVIVTKLDGTAKGGIALAVSHELGLPIYKIGVGEGLGRFERFRRARFCASARGRIRRTRSAIARSLYVSRTSPIACKAFSGLKSKGRLTEDDINAAMREIRMALLEADVNFKVVKSFIANAKERCLTAEVLDSLTPAQNVVKIVLDELTALLGQTDSGLVLSSRIPNVIMLVGLQGSGKTTAVAKLAYLLKGKGHSPLLVACDVYRPAAADQLQTLGDEMGVKVYRGDGQDPVKIAERGRSLSPSITCATWSSSTRRVVCTSMKR